MPFKPRYEGEFPSLGRSVIAHVEAYLGIELMREQAERLIHLYRLDHHGRRVVRRAALRRPKGAGKSPEGALVGFAELTGPVMFAGYDASGRVVGRPRDNRRHDEPFPWVQFAALSEDQTDNVLVWLYEVLADQQRTIDELDIDLGRTRIYLRDRPGRIEPVTAAAGSREGQPITFAVLDQSEAWTASNGGVRLAATLRRNAGKTGGWTYELQNAPAPGDGSVAEATAKAWERGQSGIFFDTRQPTGLPDLSGDRQALVSALWEVYGESAERGYVNPERLADECTDPDTLPSDAYRFYLNTPWADELHWMDERTWDDRQATVVARPGEEITAGFVGRTYMGAGMVGCRVSTGEIFTIATWETNGVDIVPRSEVHAVVEAMMESYVVRRFYVNPQEWASEYDAWRLAWGDVVVTRPPQQVARTAYAVDRFRSAIGAGDVLHDGNPVLRRHVLGCQTRRIAAGTLIVPRTDSPADQITTAKAAVLAFEARADVLTIVTPEEEPVGEFASF